MDVTLKKSLPTFKEKLFAEITEVPVILQQSHFPGLDGLRGISIIIVISSHLAMYTPITDYINGGIGVEIFFVISGFLITSLLLKEKIKHGVVSFKNFYIRRFLRIVPVAYLFLIVIIILNNRLKLGVPVKSFFASFLYVRNIPFKNTYDWYTAHFWSLSVEEQFYIAFPFFIVSRTNKFIIVAVLIILTLPLLNILGFNNVGVFYSNHIIHVFTFILIHLLGKGTAAILAGSLYSILLFKKVIVIEKLRSNYYLSFILLIIGFLVFMRISFLYNDYLAVILFPVITGYIILLNLKERNLLRNILENPILTKIGVLSYSLYIWQQFFIQKWYFFKYSDTIIVRVLMIFFVSSISYYFFEKFFLRYKAKFKNS